MLHEKRDKEYLSWVLLKKMYKALIMLLYFRHLYQNHVVFLCIKTQRHYHYVFEGLYFEGPKIFFDRN